MGLPSAENKNPNSNVIRYLHMAIDYLMYALPPCEDLSSQRQATSGGAWEDRIRAARRSLEEAVVAAKVRDDDEMVRIALYQHERALAAHEVADSHVQREEANVAALRAQVGELERLVGGGAATRDMQPPCELLPAPSGTPDGAESARRSNPASKERVSAPGSRSERVCALERAHEASQKALASLRSELADISSQLSESIAGNWVTKEKIWKIQQAHGDAVAENARAARALGYGQSLDNYRKSRERDCAAAGEALARSHAEYQSEVGQLESDCERHQQKFCDVMTELRAEASGLEADLLQRRARAERELAQQAHEWRRAVEEADAGIVAESVRLDEERRRRFQAMQDEQEKYVQQLQEECARGEKRHELQISDARLRCKRAAKQAVLKCQVSLDDARGNVVGDQRRACQLARKAEQLRETHRVHAARRGLYMMLPPTS